MGKSIKGVAGNAESLTGSAREATAAVQEMAAHPAGSGTVKYRKLHRTNIVFHRADGKIYQWSAVNAESLQIRRRKQQMPFIQSLRQSNR